MCQHLSSSSAVFSLLTTWSCRSRRSARFSSRGPKMPCAYSSARVLMPKRSSASPIRFVSRPDASAKRIHRRRWHRRRPMIKKQELRSAAALQTGVHDNGPRKRAVQKAIARCLLTRAGGHEPLHAEVGDEVWPEPNGAGTISLAVRSVNALNALSQYATDSRSALTISVLDFAAFSK
jgi:hypothetical protein